MSNHNPDQFYRFVSEPDRLGWARALRSAGWLAYAAYFMLIVSQIRRASTTGIEDGQWAPRLETLAFVVYPQNMVPFLVAAGCAIGAMMLAPAGTDLAMNWISQLVRIVAGTAYLVIVLAAIGFLTQLGDGLSTVGGFVQLAGYFGGVLLAFAVLRIGIQAERSR